MRFSSRLRKKQTAIIIIIIFFFFLTHTTIQSIMIIIINSSDDCYYHLLFGFWSFEDDVIQELNRILLNTVESSLVGTFCQVLIRELYLGTYVAKVKLF